MLYGFWLMDHGRADEMPAGVAPGALIRGLAPEPLDHAGLTAYAHARKANATRRTRHVVTNFRAWWDGSDRIRSTCLLAVHAIDGTPEARPGFFGDVEDLHVRGEDGSWRVADRRFVAFAA